MAGTGRAAVLVPVAVLVAAVASGCTSGKKAATAPVTVTASAASTSSDTSTSASGSAATASAAGSSAPGKPAPVLPRCETALPVAAVNKAMGHVVTGRTAFVVNQPDPTIKQLTRINCQYGLAAARPSVGTTAAPASTARPATTPVAQVEVSVSLYASTAAAAARITATSAQWRSFGATGHAVTVGTHSATILLGYGRPLLVLASGVRTVAVSVRPGAVTKARVDGALTQIARAALAGTGG